MHAKKDQINIGPELEGGGRVALRRREGQEDEISAIAPLKEGQPLQPGAELINIKASDDGWHDVEVLYRNGPAQVATPKYRDGYDRIFGKKEVGVA